MADWPHEDVLSLNAFYGDPRSNHDAENPAWAAENLVLWEPPYPMFFSWELSKPLIHLKVHKKCLAVFDAAFKDVLATLGLPYIKAHRLNITGGAFCYRPQRGGARLSVHSWGVAIDIDPVHNPFPHKWAAGGSMIDVKFAAIMQKHGFDWRGAGGDDDPMHFQLCRH